MVRKVLLVLFAMLLVAVAAVLFWEPATLWLVRKTAVPPDPDFMARVLPGGDSGYTLTFGEFPPAPMCEVWINGAGQVVLMTEPGQYHAGEYVVGNGYATHKVSYDPDFDSELAEKGTYNNVALFCGLPRPENGQMLVIKIPMDLFDLVGTSGFYVEDFAIDKDGNLNPGGFHAVGLSLGGSEIQPRIANGVHLHEIWGWSPIQSFRDTNPGYSGFYRLEVIFMPSGHQYAALYRDGREIGRFMIEHPFEGDIELQIWLDNYKSPIYLFPLGHANLETPEVLNLSEVRVSVEPIIK